MIEVTPQEFDFIRASIKSAYPTFNVMPDQYSIRMWYRMLGDLDYKLCETALMELFATHTYPPQISEIREKCAEYTVPHLKDQGEAWGEVQKAISQYGYYRQEEALESLTPIVREAVKRLGFREICLDENQDAVRAHFFKIYSTLIERKTNDAKLPPSILEAKNKYIAQLTTHENAAIEQQHRDQIAEEPERATPEYIDTPANQSVTHATLSRYSVLNEILTNTEMEVAEEKGCLVLSTASDGAVWLDNGVNTLVHPDANHDSGWKKIRRTKTRYELLNRANAAADALVGKVDNDTNGRATIMAAIQGICNAMEAEGKIQYGNVTESTTVTTDGDTCGFDIEVIDLDSAEHIYLNYYFQFSTIVAASGE